MKSFKLAATALILAASTGAFASANIGNNDAWIRNAVSTASAPAPVAAAGVTAPVFVPSVNP